MRADVSDEHAVRAAVDDLREILGEVDILVNNAGSSATAISSTWRPRPGMPSSPRTFAAPTCSPERCCPLFSLAFGRVVNIPSISALGHAGRANYIAAKGAITASTRAVAHEVAADGVTIDAIGPGVVLTGMTEFGARQAGRILADHIELLRQSIPVERVDAPYDVARAVAFFAADDADFVTGQILYVGGGPHG
jgi:3-oxoacyl-[acyl-carrier protein] reductase